MNQGSALVMLAALALVGLACQRTPVPPEVEEGYAEVNGARLYYKAIGSGEPIVIVHGGPTLDHGYFLPQMKPLAESYRLIFFDQRLCGRSTVDVDVDSISIAGFVEDIEGIRRSFGLEQMNLLGHSWGGLLAMSYAVRYPQRLKSLILSNPMAPTFELWQREQRLLAERTRPEDLAAREQIKASAGYRSDDPAAIAELFRVAFRGQFHDRRLADELTLSLPADIRKRSEMFNHLAPDLAAYDLSAELAQLERPTLVVYGEDEVSAELVAPEFERLLPKARVVVLERCGHFPYIERPRAYFELIHDFLERSKGPNGHDHRHADQNDQ